MAKARKKWEPDLNYVPKDHYQALTDTIVAALEGGTVPWRMPWDPEKAAGPQAPLNPTTGKRYHGVNTLILGMDPRAFVSGDPRWCSFNQARDKGWMVKKGEKATTVFFYKKLTVADPTAKDTDGKKTIPMLKTYSVFHASQIDGIPAYKASGVGEAPWLRPEAASTILKNSGAVVRVGGERAFYSPSTDHIQLPPDRAFETPAGWASTALHELGHWTGHKDRLNRDLTARFGSGAYAQEELRAELASVFIGSEVGIPSNIPGHASYVASWLNALKNDKKEIFRAAADAQRMADHCLAFHPEWKAARDVEMKSEAAEAEPEATPEVEQATAPTPDHTATKAFLQVNGHLAALGYGLTLTDAKEFRAAPLDGTLERQETQAVYGDTLADVLDAVQVKVEAKATMEGRSSISRLATMPHSVPTPDFASILSGEVEPAPAQSYSPRR